MPVTQDQNRLINTFITQHKNILRSSLVGIYLYGSRVNSEELGVYSDFDFVIVVQDEITEALKSCLLQLAGDIALPLDVTYVTRRQLNVDIVPTPLQFVIRSIEKAKLFRVPNGSVDFPFVRQDVSQHGKCLQGSDISKTFRAVPDWLLKQTLVKALPLISRFSYQSLQLSRLLYTYSSNDICSKAAAGHWGLKHLDTRWHQIIKADLSHYLTGQVVENYDKNCLLAFYNYCESKIQAD